MTLHNNSSNVNNSSNAGSEFLLGSLGDDIAQKTLNKHDLFGNIFDFDTYFGESAQFDNLNAPIQNSIFKDWDDAEFNLLGDSLAPLTLNQHELGSENFYLDVDTPNQSSDYSNWSDTQSNLLGDSIAPLTPNQLELAGNNSYVGTAYYYTPFFYWNYTHFDGCGTPIQDSVYWRHQKSNTSCAVVAQASIYQSITGKFVSQSTACQVAAANGWYNPKTGTPIIYTGKLLQAWGIPTNQGINATALNMFDALAAGNKVIAAIDGNEIWNPLRNSLTGAPVEQENALHAVWVTGLDPEPDGSWKVILNDSGSPYGQMGAVDLNDFLNAWALSFAFALRKHHIYRNLKQQQPSSYLESINTNI